MFIVKAVFRVNVQSQHERSDQNREVQLCAPYDWSAAVLASTLPQIDILTKPPTFFSFFFVSVTSEMASEPEARGEENAGGGEHCPRQMVSTNDGFIAR